MFEMFITALAAIAVAVYGFSRSAFMTGPYVFYYRAGLAIILFLILMFVIIRSWVRHHRINALHVNYDEYMYYHKYTSLLYRAGYFISYLIQNILFDYNYMRRNFNFCKGVDAYDGGVGDYYIKFRNTWFRYLKLTLLRHKVSIKKLQSFAAQQKNGLILAAMETEEEKERCINFTRDVQKLFDEHHIMGDHLLRTLPDYGKIPVYFRNNLIRIHQIHLYLEQYDPEIQKLVGFLQIHQGKDVNDYKKTIF
ncbi:MAG: hypothetical protein IJ137_02250 [Eubacterium sp.]|nr:hypothetical protein [Eubacterium sp.]